MVTLEVGQYRAIVKAAEVAKKGGKPVMQAALSVAALSKANVWEVLCAAGVTDSRPEFRERSQARVTRWLRNGGATGAASEPWKRRR
jgi:hypothetical protein